MYRAKAAGRSGYAVFDESMRDQAVSLLRMETDLRRALERKEFVLHYQPIVRLKDGSISGFEALVRWRHPSLGLVYPKKFIPLAEETGLIVPLGEWVLREACRQMAVWQRQYSMKTPLSISVNLSSRQMVPGIVEIVKGILRETGLPPESLFLEITEGTIIENSKGEETFLEEFRRMNVSVLIDDFGTGYSSMNYLNTLSIDGLKIDRSFVMTMTPAGEGKEIIGTILNLARALRLDVIAEGVETIEQLTSLRAMNGEYAQGFYFHKPMDPERIEALLGSCSLQPSFVSK